MKSAQFCLKLRNIEFPCNDCGKIFPSKELLRSHINDYSDHLKSQRLEFEAKIEALRKDNEALRKDYEDKIQKIYETRLNKHDEIEMARTQIPTTINNQYNNKINSDNRFEINTPMVSYTTEQIEEIVKSKLTFNHCVNGQPGLADFVFENLLLDKDGKSMYKVADPSRKIFVYKDADGNIKRDVKASMLIDKIYRPIGCQSQVLTINIY